MSIYNTQINNILLSSAYFPSISYLSDIVLSDKVSIEQHEHYIKQTYRNRCKIYAANGVLSLSVPVILATNKKIQAKDVKIDYSIMWQKQHFKSIESAYRTSPFYEFLIGDFEPFFTKAFTYLLDLNLNIMHTMLDILQIEKDIDLTSDYEHSPIDKSDLRTWHHPKKENPKPALLKPYPQVFDQKYGFQANLSGLDLIFNLGSEAYTYLIEKY
jgi:hypothetical protein